MKKALDNRSRKSRTSLLSFGVSALLAVGAATAQVAIGATGIDNTGSYQSEVQACMSGQTQQDQATCMKEARNAAADKRRGLVEDVNTQQIAGNAMSRCAVHTMADDRAACEARMMGIGSTDGSVAAGGMIRELETTVTSDGEVTMSPPDALSR